MIDLVTRFLETTLVMTAPMLIAAMGTLFIERSGIINIGNEGFMIIGAFMGVIGSYYSGSAFIGALTAMGSGLIFGVLFAVFVVTLRANQVVTGLAINAAAAGITALLFRQLFGISGVVPKIATFDKVAIPLLSKIPILGDSLFNQTIVAYIGLLLVPVVAFILKRTNIGLIVRSVGENPKACDTLGIPVRRVRYLSVLYGGMMAGLGGAFVSMGQLSFFTEGMIAGKGYMTLAAIVFGNYMPGGILTACLLFGAVSSLQYQLQSTASAIPYQLWVMLPYLFAVAALCMYRVRSRAPACSGVPYVRD
jgi:simple sugar transport system permease protein